MGCEQILNRFCVFFPLQYSMFAQANNAAPVAVCNSFTGDELMEIDIDKLKAEVKEVSVVSNIQILL